uniref:Uncharacterized protein n=1 Tax=Leersia perrieri TaxID=77586 RepID=A0A0D9WHX4_9ORYZ
MALLGVSDELGEAEIGDLGFEVVVEEDVGGLDVTVDDRWVGELVQASPLADPSAILNLFFQSKANIDMKMRATTRSPPATAIPAIAPVLILDFLPPRAPGTHKSRVSTLHTTIYYYFCANT